MNEEIRVPSVFLIDEEGEAIGERSVAEALALARAAELDLVEVAAAASPPVCRITDYGKFRYDLERKEKAARRNQKTISLKEVRLRPKIGGNDLAWKLDNVRTFLGEGSKVRVVVLFRGREREHPERARELLERITTAVADRGTVELQPVLEGRSMSMVLTARAGAGDG